MSFELAKFRILVVEDEYFLADEIAFTLEEAGASVVGPAGSLKDAFHLSETTEFDAAVLDINLRGEMVYPFAQTLLSRDVPFLFSTAFDEHEIDPDYRCHPRIEKPYRGQTMIKALLQIFR